MARATSPLEPLDALRSQWLRLLTPWVRPLFADRARRVLWLGLFSLGVSFITALLFPLVSIAVGPIMLGVPHLLSDVRYLVVRQALHRDRWWLLLAGLPLVATGFGAAPEVSLLAVLVSVGLAEGSLPRRALGVFAWAALTLLAWRWRSEFQFAFLHLHNVVALVLWWRWRPRPRSHLWLPVTALAGSLAILSGALDAVLPLSLSWFAPVGADVLVQQTSPPLAEPLVWRLVVSFAFLQSVHYVVWLRLIPEDDRARPAPRTFASTFENLRRDFTLPVLALVGLLAVALIAWAVVNLLEARLGYLWFAAFHGYLELAVFARLFVMNARGADVAR